MSLLDETVEVPRRTMTLFFLVDTSGSMDGKKIGAVNESIQEVLPMIRDISATNPDAEINVAALQFSTGTSWVYDEPKSADEFEWMDVSADGLTCSGNASAMLERYADLVAVGTIAGLVFSVLALLLWLPVEAKIIIT